MKITQSILKKIIKEEIEALEEMESADPVYEALQETLKFIEQLEWDRGFEQLNYGFAADRAARLKQKVQVALAGMR